MVRIPESVIKQVEKLATIYVQFDEEIIFEDHDNTSIEEANDTTKGDADIGVEIETLGVEIGNLCTRNPKK